jgi:hypothetical protein
MQVDHKTIIGEKARGFKRPKVPSEIMDPSHEGFDRTLEPILPRRLPRTGGGAKEGSIDPKAI